MSGNYPDDYNPFLPGGPDCPAPMQECDHCAKWEPCPCGCGWGWCRELDDMTAPDRGEVCEEAELTWPERGRRGTCSCT